MTFTDIWIAMLSLAGSVGLDPHDFSMAELSEMAKAADMVRWRHTTLLYSGSFQPKKTTYTQMFPYDLSTPRRKPMSEVDQEYQKKIFKGMFAR
jgi:hypothetical protein